MTALEQLELTVAGWDPSVESEVLRYDRILREKGRRPRTGWGEFPRGPYWRDLPHWLSDRSGVSSTAVSPGFVDEVVRGQTCLFYAVRIQDDLLDGAIARSPLALAPLLFLTEADRAFSSIIDKGAAFWTHYRQALESTVAGIVRVAEMQRDPTAPADALLQTYGSVDAIFSVGSAAVCEKIGDPDSIPRISLFISELGRVLLSLDDLDDIDEDLADGRLNYPGRVLLEGTISNGPDLRLLAKNWRQRADSAGYGRIKRSLGECLSRASEAIAPLGLEPVSDLVEQTGEAVQRIGESDQPDTRTGPLATVTVWSNTQAPT